MRNRQQPTGWERQVDDSMNAPPQLIDLEEFFFGAPLYKMFVLPKDNRLVVAPCITACRRRHVSMGTAHFAKQSTFSLYGQSISDGYWNDIEGLLTTK
jgi:hypothetical protein